MSKRLFELGQIVATPGALELLEAHSMTPMQFLQRHVTGDFGDLCDEDKEANNEAIWNEERILSSYKINETTSCGSSLKLTVQLCCLLPEEY